MSDHAILATRLNFSVIVFRGQTRQTLCWIGLISWSVTATLLSLIASLFFHQWLVGLGLSFPLAMPVGFGVIHLLQRLKADKPNGYLKQRWLISLARYGFMTPRFIQHSGVWSVRRYP